MGTIQEEEYQTHITRKNMARAEKDRQKELAKANPSTLMFTMDVQAVLTAPRLQVSASYYKMKLTVHNFTFYNMVSGNADCYIWHEGAGAVTANEFTSIILDYIVKNLTPDTSTIIIFSDGCGYQNRNVTLSNALLNFAENKNIEIFQYYLEKGHTQMECDSIHACIERKLKNREVYVPGCYVQICKWAKLKDPYKVHYINYAFFKKYSVFTNYSSIRPGNTTRDPKVTDIRCLAYRIDGFIDFKINYEDNWQQLPRRTKKQQENLIIPQLYHEPLKIKADKFNHLQELKKFIPEDFRQFYESLLHD